MNEFSQRSSKKISFKHFSASFFSAVATRHGKKVERERARGYYRKTSSLINNWHKLSDAQYTDYNEYCVFCPTKHSNKHAKKSNLLLSDGVCRLSVEQFNPM